MKHRFSRTAFALCTAILIAGCASRSASPSADSNTEGANRTVKVNTAKTVRDNWVPGRLFALIEQQGAAWKVVSVHTTLPARKDGQEIFLITRDLKIWETTIPPERSCSSSESGYSVCTSSLATSGFFSTKRYDPAAVRSAVNSIPEEQAKAVVAQFITAETTEIKRADAERAQRQAACRERYDAETRRINDEAGAAQAAAIAGKRLDLMEQTAIRRAQQRMSSFGTCF